MDDPKRERRASFAGVLETRVEAKEDHVVLVIEIPPASTLGIRFVSPEHLMQVFLQLMEAASEIWPDNPLVQEYLEEKNGG